MGPDPWSDGGLASSEAGRCGILELKVMEDVHPSEISHVTFDSGSLSEVVGNLGKREWRCRTGVERSGQATARYVARR